MKRLLSILLVLLMLAAIAGLLASGAGVYQFMSSWPGAQPTPLPEPTPTPFVRVGPPVIHAIRTHARLETVAMNIANDRDVTRISGIGGICTERITYLAYYDVTAGVDLSKITDQHIVVQNDGLLDQAVVTVTVPPAEILNVVLDTENSRVVAQNTPTWVPGCETQVGDMVLEAQHAIRLYVETVALDRGILTLAQEKAGYELQRLLLEAGYWNVNIQYAGAGQ